MAEYQVTPPRQIVTREQAKALGDKAYWNGRQCHAGHIEGRSTASGVCLECNRSRANKHRLAYLGECRARSREYHATHKAERTIWRKARGELERSQQRVRSLRWHQNNPDAFRAQQQRWKRDNKERCRISGRLYYLANVEKIAKRGRAYAIANHEKLAANTRNYNARKRSAEGHHTADDVMAIYNRQKGKCIACLCRLAKKYEVDHKVAIFNGGSNWPSNLQIMCVSCNRSKCAKDRYQWAREQGLLCM